MYANQNFLKVTYSYMNVDAQTFSFEASKHFDITRHIQLRTQ